MRSNDLVIEFLGNFGIIFLFLIIEMLGALVILFVFLVVFWGVNYMSYIN